MGLQEASNLLFPELFKLFESHDTFEITTTQQLNLSEIRRQNLTAPPPTSSASTEEKLLAIKESK